MRLREVILVRQDTRERWTPDGVLAIRIGSTYTVTDHPVEKGTPSTDNIKKDPDTITITCVLTETPDDPRTTLGGLPHIRQELGKLRAIADAGQLVDVVVRKLGVFEGFAITSIPRDLDNVARIRFDLALKQVRIATARTIQIEVIPEPIVVEDIAEDLSLGAVPEVDSGEQPTEVVEVIEATPEDPVPEQEDPAVDEDQSVLAAGLWW